MQKKIKKTQVPIEEARNLGPSSGNALRNVGIDTLEKLISIGWKQACLTVALECPKTINMNFFMSIIGAISDKDWRNIDPKLKEEAKALLNDLKN